MAQFQDITAPEHPVEVDIRFDGQVLWVNVDGKCVLRICQMPGLILNDQRRKTTKRSRAALKVGAT
jgi:hypothetical protein